MKRWLLAPMVVVAMLALTAPALASSWHHRNHEDRSYSAWYEDRGGDDEDSDEVWDDEDSNSEEDDSDSGDTPTADPVVGPVVVTGAEKSIQAELTGYSYQDNTPPGSADICCPQLHQKAGGQGTYADPITTAVASSSFPPGTRFYIPPIKRYVIVEDSGASDGQNHLDIWVGGQGHSKSDSDACMDDFTGNATIIQNPAPGHPVVPGELTGSGGCNI